MMFLFHLLVVFSLLLAPVDAPRQRGKHTINPCGVQPNGVVIDCAQPRVDGDTGLRR